LTLDDAESEFSSLATHKAVSAHKPLRLAALFSHPIQYFAPLFRALAARPEVDLTVYYCSRQGVDEYKDAEFGTNVKWDTPLLDGYKYRFLTNWRHTRTVGGFLSLVNPSIVRELGRERYDAVLIHGYSHLTDWLAILAARLVGTAILYHSESSLTYDSRVRRPFHVQFIKPRLLRFLFRHVARFLAIGTLNRKFYLHYGAKPEYIYHVPYAVDNEYFASKAGEFRLQRNVIRTTMGINTSDIVFLFAAKMTPKKAPLELLQAYGQMGQMQGKTLIMVGDGRIRSQAEAYVRENELSNVHFVGFVNQSELPRYYAISDVFIRPDGLYVGDWGLTVNEAMACGLAIISTDAIGATVDLVKDGENGMIVKYGDLNQLSRAMQWMVSNPGICREMGTRSFEIISGWSYKQCAEGVVQALNSLKASEKES